MQNPFHVVIDIKDIKDTEKLQSCQQIEDYINSVCKIFNLKAIGIPTIHKFSGGGGGITAAQVLGASLLSLHTYPEHGILYIDIFSCEEFDYVEAFEYTKKYFNSQMGYLERVKRLCI